MDIYNRHTVLSAFLADYHNYSTSKLAPYEFIDRARALCLKAKDASDSMTTSAIEKIISGIASLERVDPKVKETALSQPPEPAPVPRTTAPAKPLPPEPLTVPQPLEPAPDYSKMPIEERFATFMNARTAGIVVGVGYQAFLREYSAYKSEGHLKYSPDPEHVTVYDIARLVWAYNRERQALQMLHGMALKGRTLDSLEHELNKIEIKMQPYLKWKPITRS